MICCRNFRNINMSKSVYTYHFSTQYCGENCGSLYIANEDNIKRISLEIGGIPSIIKRLISKNLFPYSIHNFLLDKYLKDCTHNFVEKISNFQISLFMNNDYFFFRVLEIKEPSSLHNGEFYFSIALQARLSKNVYLNYLEFLKFIKKVHASSLFLEEKIPSFVHLGVEKFISRIEKHI